MGKDGAWAGLLVPRTFLPGHQLALPFSLPGTERLGNTRTPFPAGPGALEEIITPYRIVAFPQPHSFVRRSGSSLAGSCGSSPCLSAALTPRGQACCMALGPVASCWAFITPPVLEMLSSPALGSAAEPLGSTAGWPAQGAEESASKRPGRRAQEELRLRLAGIGADFLHCCGIGGGGCWMGRQAPGMGEREREKRMFQKRGAEGKRAKRRAGRMG